jgi:hypothetical protein
LESARTNDGFAAIGTPTAAIGYVRLTSNAGMPGCPLEGKYPPKPVVFADAN